MYPSPAAPSMLLTRFFTVAHEANPHIAIQDQDEAVSFSDLGVRVRRVATRLASLGLAGPAAGATERAPRVALLCSQGSAWVEGLFGILLSGATAVPLSHLHPASEQRWFVEASGASSVVVSDDLRAELEGRGEALGLGVPLVSIEQLRGRPGAAGDTSSGEPETLFPTDSLPANAHPALILYTSGTTGKPKGALITHANLGTLAGLLSDAWEWTPQDRLLHCLPLHHLHGLGIALLVSLLSGATTRMLRRFDASLVWAALSDVNVLMGVPTMHKLLLDALDRADSATQAEWRQNARGLRLVTSGSAALPASVGGRWEQLTGDYPLERFGMTEIGVGLTNPVRGKRKPGSCGRALPGMEIRVVREDGSDTEPGEPGEIWIKGPSVFAGYDQNPEATREAFVDGWFRSGDTAAWDEDGYCRILGRTSVDILKSSGYKLSALEIEELLREHPAVADVAVVGIPDETWGELVVASVIPEAGRADEVEEPLLREWAKQRVAAYKVPRRVLCFDAFPRNPVGKVVKPELRAWVLTRLEELAQ